MEDVFPSDVRPVTGEDLAAIVTRHDAYSVLARYLIAVHRNVQVEGRPNPKHYDLDLLKLSNLACETGSRDYRSDLMEPCLIEAAHQVCQEGWLRPGPKNMRFTQHPNAYGTCFCLTAEAMNGFYEVGYM